MLDVILRSAEPGKWPMFLSALEDDGMLKLDTFWLKGRGLHKRIKEQITFPTHCLC